MSDTLEQKYYVQTFVTPQWLPGGKTFWYRRETDNRFEFILVDITQQTIRPAFDHEQLAKQLEQHAGVPIDSGSLPFTWIEIEDGFVRFRFKKQIWQYDPNNQQISKWDGVFTQGNPALTYKPVSGHQAHHSGRAHITFINNTISSLDMYSVGRNGESKFLTSIQQGQMIVQRVITGSTCKFMGRERLKGIYHVPDVINDTVFLEETNIDEYMGSFSDVLPEWWEERMTQEGRLYYVDHKTQSTTWQAPISNVLKDVQSEQQTLITTGAEKQDGSEKKTDEQDSKLKSAYNNKINITIQEYNLWIETAPEHRYQLSKNGTEDRPYSQNMVYPSPTKEFIMAWQYTPFRFNTFYNIDHTPDNQIQPKLLKELAVLPGDPIRVDRPRLFDLANKCEVATTDDLFSNPFCLYNIGWSSDGDEYRFVFVQRGYKRIRVIGINCAGSVRIIIEETSQTFVDSFKLYYRPLPQSRSDRMIWASERDGYNHLYLVDLKTGQVQNQITKGQWNIRSVEYINEESEEIWASAYGYWENQDPYYVHLIHVKFDGTDCKPLTEGDGTHRWSYPWAKDSRYYFVDTWSRVDLPPQTVVRCFQSGKLEFSIHRPTSQELLALGWDPVERFVALGRDGITQIYGLIARPPNFDKAKTFPVLESIYAGPHTFSVIKSFDRLSNVRERTEGGYIVVQIDGMGTNWRSKAFHDICYKNLKDAGFPDRILWMQEAAKTRPWMDLSRVGIMGNSAGGQNAVSALLHHGDFYKVAVSCSGCHDNRLNDHRWAEQWMGYPVDGSYSENSNMTHAGKLRDDAKLLLIAGGLDTMVNSSSTMRLATELNKNGKDYDFFFIPEGDHYCGGKGAGLRRVARFLREHLSA